MKASLLPVASSLLLSLGVAGGASAQTIAPDFAGAYSLVNLGSPTGVPNQLGGLTLRAGDPNTLLIGGAANVGGGIVSQIGLARTLVDGKSRISGFVGAGTTFATAPNIDGGLAYAPNGSLLFTGYPVNTIGEIRPGSTSPDRTTTVSQIASSVGALTFVPAGLPGAGRLKALSYNANRWYDLPYTLGGDGLYTFGTPTGFVQLSGGLEGAVFVPAGSALFPRPSVLVAEYLAGRVSAYDVDANGDPLAATRRDFVTGLSGAEGAFIDPSTGDFLFSTFGSGNQVVSVRGFAAPVPEPATLAALGLGLAALARRRRL